MLNPRWRRLPRGLNKTAVKSWPPTGSSGRTFYTTVFAGGLSVYVRKDGISYQVVQPEQWQIAHVRIHDSVLREYSPRPSTTSWRIWWVDIDFVEGTIQSVEASEPLPGYINYYNVPAGVEPVLFLQRYKQLRLKEVWPGVDMLLFERDGKLEVEWHLAKAEAYRRIRLRLSGGAVSVA